jgi:hypothetical protein
MDFQLVVVVMDNPLVVVLVDRKLVLDVHQVEVPLEPLQHLLERENRYKTKEKANDSLIL